MASKNSFAFHLHYSLLTDLYDVPLDRLDLIYFNMYNLPKCIDLQKASEEFLLLLEQSTHTSRA